MPAGANPLHVLMRAVDALGPLLSDAEQDALLAELQKAATRSSGLLAPLARDK